MTNKMTLTIGGFEIEIKARKSNHDNYNLADTQSFLNEMACNLLALANYMSKSDSETIQKCAKYIRDDKNDIHNALDEMGYYDDIRAELNVTLHD